MEPSRLNRKPRTWRQVMSRIANRLGWAQRMPPILGQLDSEEKIAPESIDDLPESVHTAISDDVLLIRADVLGFRPEELELTIEARCLTIAARRKTPHHRELDEVIYLDQSPDLMLRILQLPREIDPKRSTATLRGGILEVSLATAFPQCHTLFGADTHWVA